MRVEVRNRVEVDETYRVARAYGLYNVTPDLSQEFNLDAEVPIERNDWQIGVVYGPSGSGKTSIARELSAHGWTEWGNESWPRDKAIIDVIEPDGDFEAVTGTLASVGLGAVPSWLRPYYVLSNGEQFRASMARLLAGDATDVYVDEFTSLVNRRVAQIGSQAFAKALRRGPQRRVVLISPHYDILGWVKPDWVIRTSLAGTTEFASDYDGVPLEVARSADAAVVVTVTA